MATWPASLPQKLLTQGHQQSLADVTLQTQMDAGPPKSRRRLTANVEPVRGSIFVTLSQWSTLKTFHDSTLKGGSLEFDWEDPITGNSVSMKFRRPPTATNLGGDEYRVSMMLDIQP